MKFTNTIFIFLDALIVYLNGMNFNSFFKFIKKFTNFL